MTILDLSSYDLPTFDAACMASSGVSGAILGVYSPTNPPYAMGEVHESLAEVGVPTIGFYGLIYFGSAYGRTRDTKWAVVAGSYSAPWWWIPNTSNTTQFSHLPL